MGVYGRYSRRRRAVRARTYARYFQPARPAVHCSDCGARLLGYSEPPARPVRCEDCTARAILRAAGEPVPAWGGRLFVRDVCGMGLSVWGLCVGAHGPAVPLAVLDETGRCPFCAAPGRPVPGTDNLKTDGDVLLVREGSRGFYSVRLAGGKLPVHVFDQGCNPWDRGPALVEPGSTPAWGTGWQVLPIGSTEHVWFMAHWDSSG